MSRTVRILLVATMAVTVADTAAAQTAAKRQPTDLPRDYQWENEAKLQKLGTKDLELLRQNRFVISGEGYRQIFQPYLGGSVPVFVTTDSLLNGYHVLFEESIYQLEKANAGKLLAILARLAKNLDQADGAFPGDPALLAAARQRARIFLGTARNLLDAGALPEDSAVRKLVQEEVERVVAARETKKPAWLGAPDDGFRALDYSRFQPRGFYTKSPILERYFRTVSWLQAIPFRLDKDEELVAFLLLSHARHAPDQKDQPAGEDFWQAFRQFLGAGDDWDLLTASELPTDLTKQRLANVREYYQKQATAQGRSQINDQLRFIPADGQVEITFRFLSAYRLPDAVLFQRTTTDKLQVREFPSGLEVGAVLGSTFARDKLAGKEDPKLLEEIDRARPLFKGTSLYVQYLQCLAVLLERTEPDAPAFMHREAWKIKTCQTALAGWAQMRHTWALQAKQGIEYMCGSSCAAGFVEPVPEFYGRLAQLIEATQRALDRAGALTPTDTKELVLELDKAVAIVAKVRKEKKGLGAFSQEEKALLAQFDPRLNHVWELPEKARDSDKVLADLAELLDFYQSCAGGKYGPETVAQLMGLEDIAPKWTRLADVCHRLEILAHKQLRQVAFSDEEDAFLRGYGKQLAGIMFYGGNSYVTPRDDCPRIVDVFSNPSAGKYLLVGVGRPRVLWVLYPVKGVDVLCRGAVLPYQEFTHGQRLTDTSWKSLLDSRQRPETPAWIQPILAPAP